jgi:hypothetical protein
MAAFADKAFRNGAANAIRGTNDGDVLTVEMQVHGGVWQG